MNNELKSLQNLIESFERLPGMNKGKEKYANSD